MTVIILLLFKRMVVRVPVGTGPMCRDLEPALSTRHRAAGSLARILIGVDHQELLGWADFLAPTHKGWTEAAGLE